MINYQGRLIGVGGNPLDTTVSMTFVIYDDSTAGMAQWSESKPSVAVVDGLFSVTLGTGSPIYGVVFSGPDRYLGITVGSDPEISPRTRLVSAAYAYASLRSDSAGYAFTIADGSVTSAKLAAEAVTGEKLHDGAVNSSKIEDGTIQFIDIGRNDAATGQVIKWSGTGWIPGDDEAGISGGWIDDGDVIRLETDTDSVGIGTAAPADKLDVAGGAHVSGDVAADGRIAIGGAPTDSAVIAVRDKANSAGIWARSDDWPVLIAEKRGGGDAVNILKEDDPGYALWIVHKAGSPALVIQTDTSECSPALLWVESDGRVGIGTSTPGDALEVAGIVHTTLGGVRFPDGTLQATAAVGGNGWEDTGTVVRLETNTDSVGIGMTAPTERLDVDGNIRATGNIKSGHSLTIDGSNDRITATSGTIDFDDEDVVTTGRVTIGPGHTNTGVNAFAAGEVNSVTGRASAVTGGKWNVVDGDYSAICGGFGDTIALTADYSYIFGIGSKVTEDSTIMVDMPHIRFGSEATGYEFPASDGESGQIMTSDGSGMLSWSDPVGGGWYDQGTWLRLTDFNDNVNIGGASYPSEKLYVNGDMRAAGKANIGSNNTNTGSYSFVVGQDNGADGDYAAVCGGDDNTASGSRSAVAGGADNTASGSQSCVSGGANNTAAGSYSTVAGGRNNTAGADYSFAAGKNSKANHAGAVVISANFSINDADSVRSGGMDQMVLRAEGGMYITNTNQAELAPYITGRLINTSSGACLSTGGIWTNAPPRESMDRSVPVDGRELLDKIAELPIARWSFSTEDHSEDHISPTAEDFYALFDVGDGGGGISTIDPAGIALAAIKELYKKAQEIDQLKAEVAELREIVDELTKMR
jgi:hypothetical protein